MEIFEKPNEAEVKELLSASGLPASDITKQHLAHFFGCGSGGKLEGVVGLELYGDVALLRSLAVRADRSGEGIGSRLVTHAESYARDQGAISLFLLTMTAEAFFRSRGYCAVAREQAPPAIKATREFAGICPANSTFMVKHLKMDGFM
ncbi:MAG: GNAT family N-acetyltransferase [Desulfobacteraceae bacterium]|nr:MAG: GNAT family N-acetyltransferase [Desulfobacteraceae bacterium]